MKLHHFPNHIFEQDTFVVHDDFTHFVDGDQWTMLDADTGATVAEDADGVNGVVTLTTGATDNNEANLATSNEVLLFAAGKPMRGIWYIQYAEANTDDANVAVGFADAPGANLLQDDGAGVSTSLNSAALIYKLDGGTVWRCYTENNGSSTDTVSTATAGGADYQKLEIIARAIDGSIDEYEVTFFVDNVALRDSNNNEIKHTVSYTSATQMDVVAGYVKAGGANSEVLDVDYVTVAKKR